MPLSSKPTAPWLEVLLTFSIRLSSFSQTRLTLKTNKILKDNFYQAFYILPIFFSDMLQLVITPEWTTTPTQVCCTRARYQLEPQLPTMQLFWQKEDSFMQELAMRLWLVNRLVQRVETRALKWLFTIAPKRGTVQYIEWFKLELSYCNMFTLYVFYG